MLIVQLRAVAQRRRRSCKSSGILSSSMFATPRVAQVMRVNSVSWRAQQVSRPVSGVADPREPVLVNTWLGCETRVSGDEPCWSVGME